MKAQTALELMVVLAIGLAVIGLIFVSGYERVAGSQSAAQVAAAQAAADDIAKAADSVWFEGAGSRKSIFIDLPEGINESVILGSTIRFRLSVPGGVTDVAAKSSAPLFGSINTRSGGQLVLVSATESGVRIGSLDLNVDPSLVLTQVAVQNTSQFIQKTFNVSNTGASPMDVTLLLTWSPGLVNVTLANTSDSFFTLSAGAIRTITLNETITENILGSFTGFVDLNASNGDEASVDVVVEIISPSCPACPTCPPCIGGNGTESVSYFNVITCQSASCAVEKLVFNSTVEDRVNIFGTGTWTSSANLTLNLTYPNSTTVPTFPRTILTNSTGGFTETWFFNGTNPNGVYTLYANQSATTNSTTFTMTC